MCVPKGKQLKRLSLTKGRLPKCRQLPDFRHRISPQSHRDTEKNKVKGKTELTEAAESTED
jgi:hypothetical protein